MPNWTYTQLTVTGPISDLVAFKEKAVDKKEPGRALSFDSFVPMPESLHVEKGSNSTNAMAVYGSNAAERNDWRHLLHIHGVSGSGVDSLEGLQLLFDVLHPEYREMAATIESNISLYGHADWYDWSCENWGTKWDACEVCIEDEDFEGDKGVGSLKYSFNTAWSPAEPVLYAMSEQFPSLTFIATFDEEGAAFYYQATFEGGNKTEQVDLERDDVDEDFYEKEDEADACQQLIESVQAVSDSQLAEPVSVEITISTEGVSVN